MKRFFLKYKSLFGQFLLITVIFVAGLLIDDNVALRIWGNLLTANWFFLLISVSGIFLTCLHYLSGAKWSEPLLPFLRGLKKGIPPLSFTFIAMLAGTDNLFNMVDQSNSKIIGMALLTVTASALLFFVYFFDEIFKNRKFTKKQRSIIELLVLIPALYILGKVWLLNLYPSFSNPVFVFYLISCSLLLGLSVAIILFISNHTDQLKLDKTILYKLGRYLMALLMIRGYLWFTQYLIISYAGIANETSLLANNIYLEGYFILGILFSFLIPFIFLLFRKVKESSKFIYCIAVLIIIGCFLDLCYLVFNSALDINFRMGLIDIGMFYGFIIVFLGFIVSSKKFHIILKP